MALLPSSISASEFFTPVVLSFQVAAVAGIVVIILGTLAGAWMSRASFFGKTALETCFMLPLVLPPTVVGFFFSSFSESTASSDKPSSGSSSSLSFSPGGPL